MAVAYKRFDGEVLVNRDFYANHFDQTNPEVVALASGGFLVTWTDTSPVEEDVDRSGSSIKGQLYGSDGDPVGGEFLINMLTGGHQMAQTVTALDSGGFVVTWQSEDGVGEAILTSGIKAQVFGADGSKIGSEALVNTTVAGDQVRPVISSLSSGGYAISWTDYSDPVNPDIKIQIFSESGARIGGEIAVPTNLAGRQVSPAIDSLPTGGFVISWTDGSGVGGDDSGTGIKAQLFSASGARIGSEFRVNSATAGDQFLPAIATLSSGGFVVTWIYDTGAIGSDLDRGRWNIAGQLFDSNGAKIGGQFRIGETAAGVQMDQTVTALPSGGFIVSWADGSGAGGDASGLGIRAQAYDGNGLKVGAEFLLNSTTAGSQQEPDLVVLRSGRIASTWTDYSGLGGDSSGSSIKLQLLSPVNVVAGTTNADHLAGTTGDDLLEGLEGDDFLRGGAGDDELHGGEGADRLDGGAGADIMEGGAGDDTYYIDTSDDVVAEAAGAGIDTVRSAIAYTLGTELENLILTGTAAIGGTGNALANAITGNAAANRIDGGEGVDVMRGGAGSDVYVVDHASDRVIEGVNAGSDKVESAVTYRLGANVDHLVLTGEAAINGTGNGLANRIAGNGAANILNGGAGADRLMGGAGDDLYIVDTRADRIAEALDGGSDTVRTAISFKLDGGIENLVLTGVAAANGSGNNLANRITGNEAVNILNGGAGADLLRGLGGNDLLVGGTGNDSLVGGVGSDRFYFDTGLHRLANVDEIVDFSARDDTIFLSRAIFQTIAGDGRLQADAFHVGSAAGDAEDRIVYDAQTGQLFYDADGTGSGAAILFARLESGLALTNADFVAYLPEI